MSLSLKHPIQAIELQLVAIEELLNNCKEIHDSMNISFGTRHRMRWSIAILEKAEWELREALKQAKR